MKSFNLLLDDFEESVGRHNLPRQYFDERLELTSSLVVSAGSLSSDVDQELHESREEFEKVSSLINETEIKRKVQHELEDWKEKLRVYEDDKFRLLEELERRKAAVTQRKKQIQDSSKLLRRIFGSSTRTEDKPTLAELEARVRDTELKVDFVTKKVTEQLEKIGSVNVVEKTGQSEDEIPKLRKKLEAISATLEDLESKRSVQSELLDERLQTTEQMREVIASISIQASKGNE